MDKQEIITFTDLYVKFQKQCNHVAEILSEYNRDFNEAKYNIWKIDYSVYAMDCWVKSRILSFPAELLSATDEQIHEYASSKYKKE